MPIFDQGYQHWSGRLSGHGWRWLAIARNGIRTGLQTQWIRITLLLSWMPALVLAAFLCIWGMLERKSSVVQQFIQFLTFLDPRVVADPKHYRVVIWTLAFQIFLIRNL